MIAASPPQQQHPIPLTDPKLAEVMRLIPPHLHPHAWVAGSAACQWPHNGDIDVWLTLPVGVSVDFEPPLYNMPDYDPILRAIPDQFYCNNSTMLHIAPGIHILMTQLTIQAILEEFDIAQHAAAIHGTTGECVQAAGYIGSSCRNICILGFVDPKRTLTRALKFATRYQGEVELDDMGLQCVEQALGTSVLTAEERELWDQVKMPRGL